MRHRAARTALAGLALLLLTGAGCGGGDAPSPPQPAPATSTADGGDTPGPATTTVPARYQGLIRSEMTRVEPAMQRLLSLIARGNATAGAHVAREIQGTFVLASSLTPEQRDAMVAALPQGFVELDREFHHRAGLVAQHLDRGDFQGAVDAYAAMTRQCVACHGRYARHRFPTLPAPAAPETPETPEMPETPPED